MEHQFKSELDRAQLIADAVKTGTVDHPAPMAVRQVFDALASTGDVALRYVDFEVVESDGEPDADASEAMTYLPGLLYAFDVLTRGCAHDGDGARV